MELSTATDSTPNGVYTQALLLIGQGVKDIALAGEGVCGAEPAALRAIGAKTIRARISTGQPFRPNTPPWPTAAAATTDHRRLSETRYTLDHCDVCRSFVGTECVELPRPGDTTASQFDCVTIEDTRNELARRGCRAVDPRWLCARQVCVEVDAIEPLCCVAQPLRMLPHVAGEKIYVRVRGGDISATKRLAELLANASHVALVTGGLGKTPSRRVD